MVLLEALHRLGCERDLTVLHVDHGLRAESEADARFVAARALAMGLRHESTRIDVAGRLRASGGNLQETARDARYRWFAERAAARGLAAVFTAHHADDQSETVALALLRGADTLALGGIPVSRPLASSAATLVVRPWHAVPRADIEEAARRWRVPRRDDASNDAFRYRRNLIRHVMLPAMNCEDDLSSRLVRLGERAAAAERRVDGVARALENTLDIRTVDEDTCRRVIIPRAELAPLPEVVATRILERAIARCRPDRPHLGRRTARRLLEARTSETIELTRGLHLDVDRHTLTIRHAVDRELASVTPLLLHPGAGVDIPWDGRRIDLALFPEGSPGHSPFEQWLPSRRVEGTLTVRGPRQGERLQPFGMDGTKLVADLMAEAGIPATTRWRTPVVSDDRGILWIPGVRAAERCRVTRSEELLRVAISTS